MFSNSTLSKSIRSVLVIALTLLLVTIVGLPKSHAQTGTDPVHLELVGEVEALSTTTLTINGQVIDISTAELNTTLAVGDVVKIEGTLAADGSIVATEVNPVEDTELQPGEVEITGPIEAIDGATITIGGLMIDVATAELSQDLTLEVGLVVKVHMSLVADTTAGTASWVAREVETHDPADDTNPDDNSTDPSTEHPGEFEIVGTLTLVDGDTITVSGMTIDISTAEIKGTLVEGALVKVHLCLVDGVLVAREVELHASSPSNDSNDSNDSNHDDNSNANNNSNSNANENESEHTNANANSNTNSNPPENENESEHTNLNTNQNQNENENEHSGGGSNNNTEDHSGSGDNNDDHGGGGHDD